MPATLRTLCADPRFGVRLIGTVSDPSALDSPIEWAHSSDLTDPTPWLEPGQLLLTNGAHFPPGSPADWAGYVDRLVASSIGGLGFATDVVHDHLPDDLVAAAGAHDLPLLEVTGRTPFIAIIRYVADTLAAEQRERLEWSLSAHRALARAALRPDGLAAVLHELERQLDCWVALFDAGGSQVPAPSTRPMPEAVVAEVTTAARSVLRRGHRAGMRLSTADGDVTLQTLGQRDDLRGVLAVGTGAPLDSAGTDVMASVLALASISVEQGRALDSARADLRAGLLELLLAGAVSAADATADRVSGPLPAEPIRVATFPENPDTAPTSYALTHPERGADRGWFVATRAGDTVVVLPADDIDDLEANLEQHGVAAGVSAPGGWSDIERLLTEARSAYGRGHGEAMVTRFETRYGTGMVGLIDEPGAREAARRLLEPILTSTDPDALVGTMRVWLAHGCAWDPAARELGIHRHTLRNRARTVEALLGLDLGDMGGRSELWLALQFLDEPHRT